MHVTVLCALPLEDAFAYRFCATSFQWGAQGMLGFGIRARTSDHHSLARPLTFFQIESISGRVFSQTLSLSSDQLQYQELFYDETLSSWMMSLSGRNGEIELLRFSGWQHERQPPAAWLVCTRLEEAPGRSDQVGLATCVQCAPTASWRFEVSDLLERGDGEVYWFHLTPGTVPPERRLQRIGTGSRVVHYATEQTCLFVLLQQSSLPERARPFEQQESGHWQFLLATYEPDGIIRRQTVLPRVTAPVHYTEFSGDDLDQGWLKPGMCVVAGPAFVPKNEHTCIAALTLLTGTPPNEQFTGGLFLLNMWGEVLQHDPGSLGETPRLWSAGEGVVGIDAVGGEKRLWQWLPLSGKPLDVLALFPEDVRRVTLVVPPSEQGRHDPLFWCLEEYARGVRISRWAGYPMTEQQTVWWKGGQLLARADGQIQGAVASADELFLLAFDQQQTLTLFRVHEGSRAL